MLNIFLNLGIFYSSVSLVMVTCSMLTIQKQAGRRFYFWFFLCPHLAFSFYYFKCMAQVYFCLWLGKLVNVSSESWLTSEPIETFCSASSKGQGIALLAGAPGICHGGHSPIVFRPCHDCFKHFRLMCPKKGRKNPWQAE